MEKTKSECANPTHISHNALNDIDNAGDAEFLHCPIVPTQPIDIDCASQVTKLKLSELPLL